MSFLLIAGKAVSVGMDRYLSLRYWWYAFPSYFSEVTYGAPRYTYFTGLMLRFGSQDPFGDREPLQRVLTDAAAGRLNASGPLRLFPGDEKGTVDFIRLAFAIFGVRLESAFYLYCSLLAISVFAFVSAFRRDSAALLIGVVAMAALYVAVRTFPVTRELYSVTNPRAMGSLSIIALLHLSLSTLRGQRLTVGTVAGLTFQAALIVLVLSMRTAETWQIVALVAVTALVAMRRGLRPSGVSTFAPAGIVLAIVAVFAVYQTVAYPQEYFSRNLRGKMFWHNVLIGFAVHPGIAEWYQLRLDDASVATLIRRRAAHDSTVSLTELFERPGENPNGFPVKNFREYERLCRRTVFAIVAAHPWQTLKLFVWHKPVLLVRSLAYSAGRETHDLDYYYLRDQAISLPAYRERNDLGAFFDPFSPIVLVLVLSGCLIVGVARLKDAFDANMCAAAGLFLCASLLPAFITYPLIHVIAGTYWAAPFVLYAVTARGGAELARLAQDRLA